MSVVDLFPVLQRPWRGYGDRGLPVGSWIAQGTILGDASGGSQALGMVFKGEGLPLGGRFYNVEQMEIHTTDITSTNADFSITNMDILGSTGLVTRRYHLDIITDGITNSAWRPAGGFLPVFLGRPTIVGVESNIFFAVANVLNETLFATAQGYIWEPRSLLQDGGLRRPADSLYG